MDTNKSAKVVDVTSETSSKKDKEKSDGKENDGLESDSNEEQAEEIRNNLTDWLADRTQHFQLLKSFVKKSRIHRTDLRALEEIVGFSY